MPVQFLLLCTVTLTVVSASYENEPANLTLLREAADSKGAVCLDGSPPGYFFRPGKGSGSNKWLLHLMGGGWCFHGSYECYDRSSTIYGSSDTWPSTYEFHGALSSDMNANPTFYNWNMAFFMYCDGASFAGDREEPDMYSGKKLYYRGYRILTAIMEDLNKNRNLTQATDVVLTGCSAGGLAVYMHMNYIQTLIPATARYSGLPDAGFFIDIPSYHKDHTIASLFALLIDLQSVDKALMDQCKTDNLGNVWKCMYAPYIYKYIKAPIMVLNSRYDTAQINSLFSLPCLPPNCTDQEEISFFNSFAKAFKEQIQVVTNDTSSTNSYFLDSCLVHCQTMDDHPWTEFKVQGRSMSQAVYDWYYNSEEPRADDCDYPCNPTCPGVYPPHHKLSYS